MQDSSCQNPLKHTISSPEQFHVLREEFERRRNGRERRNREFEKGLGKHASVAVEVTGNTWMFCWVLKEHVGRLVIVNPNQFKVISRSVKVCPQFPLNLSEERILRISRTIADLFGSKELKREHIFEAIGYRALDRRS